MFRAIAALAAAASLLADSPVPPSAGLYRLPFADGLAVQVFDDARSHRPIGRVDLFATNGTEPFAVVAAAPGRIMAIQDGFSEQQSGRAAKDCHNNYVWIAHANGEWTRVQTHKTHHTIAATRQTEARKFLASRS